MLGDDVLNIEGYTWFGFNRETIHRNAKSGSGGVGFLIKNRILRDFHVSVLDRAYEGILWLRLVNKEDGQVLLPCVCYLPPENSSRPFDVNAFYEHLLVNIYQYQKEGIIFICGDFNSRCGELDDFIVGVDNIIHRNTLDYTVNYYGELFIDFLINTNMIMLNGRFNKCDDNFTSISVKGHSIVDYCITKQEQLGYFSDFKVMPTSQIMNRNCNVGTFVPSCIPDHSLLTWKIKLEQSTLGVVNESEIENSHTSYKFDLKNVKNDFMSNQPVLREIGNLISKLEQDVLNLEKIDNVYTQWCGMVKYCMF